MSSQLLTALPMSEQRPTESLYVIGATKQPSAKKRQPTAHAIARENDIQAISDRSFAIEESHRPRMRRAGSAGASRLAVETTARRFPPALPAPKTSVGRRSVTQGCRAVSGWPRKRPLAIFRSWFRQLRLRLNADPTPKDRLVAQTARNSRNIGN